MQKTEDKPKGLILREVAVQGKLIKVSHFDYNQSHSWINLNFKKPKFCQNCLAEGKTLFWANVTGIYKSDIKNFKAFCNSCHKKFDNGTLSFCRRGHERKEENYVKYKNGTQGCIVCKRIVKIQWKLRLNKTDLKWKSFCVCGHVIKIHNPKTKRCESKRYKIPCDCLMFSNQKVKVLANESQKPLESEK